MPLEAAVISSPYGSSPMKLSNTEFGELRSPPPVQPTMPPQFPGWSEPARQYQDVVFDDPRTARPDSTLHLSPSPKKREFGEIRLVTIANADSARDRGVDLTVIHAAENGGEGDFGRADTLLAEYNISNIPENGVGPLGKSDQEDEDGVDPVAALWRCMMKALVEGRETEAEEMWRVLRGSMQCVLKAGYKHGWDTDTVKAGPSSPSKFVRKSPQKGVVCLDDAQQVTHAPDEMTALAFSPDCRYVAEYGNSTSGGGASFTSDEWKVLVYDTTTGICVHEQVREETQQWCEPYRHMGGTIKSVKWHHPHTLEVAWSDGQVDSKEFALHEIVVSSHQFSPVTWQQ